MRLSIITPSYNQGEFLERTLRSVVSQLTPDVEYIVIDGLSADNSIKILQCYADQISTLIIEADDGQADALAKGFEIAQGQILAYLNSDDVLLPGTIDYVLQYFSQHSNVDAVYGDRIFVDSEDRITGYWKLPPHSNYCMSRWDFIPQETCFWRRDLMQRAGPIDRSFGFALDYDLFVRMMKLGTFQHESKFLAAFRVHPAAKSSVLYETMGRAEVARVRTEQDIPIHWYDQLLKYCFGGSILLTSYIYKLFKWRSPSVLEVESING